MNCKTKSFMTKKKAFTLIELLIVIAIIGILFIVLVSKVDFATDKAKATGVQTDFRSFQMAFDTVAKENAGFNTFGWDTGDLNQDGKRNSYDEGDNGAGGGIAQNGIQDGTEVFTGHKVYAETFTKVFSLKKAKADGTLEDNYDRDALNRLETAINANLDPKLHITIKDDGEIVMANGAQDPWNKEYHGWYITNAEVDKKDRGAIVMYSDGANNTFGSEHKIENGVVAVTVPGSNKAGKDDYSIVSCYTYVNGYGEVLNITTGFSNNQGLHAAPSISDIPTVDDGGSNDNSGDGNNGGNQSGNVSGGNQGTSTSTLTLNEYGFYFNQPYQATLDGALYEYVFYPDGSASLWVSYGNEHQGMYVPAGGAIYTENTITIGGDPATVSDNGKTLTASGIVMILNPTINQKLKYNVLYENANEGVALMFKSDGSVELYEGNTLFAALPAGSAVLHDYYVDLTIDGETIPCPVYPNGSKMIVSELVLVCGCNHERTTIKNIAATCGTAGMNNAEVCVACEAIIKEGSAVPATGNHVATEIRNNSEVTCGNAGYTGDEVCIECNAVVRTGSIIPATGIHNNTTLTDAKEASCIEDGYSGNTYCNDCNTTIRGTIIPSTGHIFADNSECTICGYAIVSSYIEGGSGLYQTGSNYTIRIKTWDSLINEGIIASNGKVISGQETKLTGDLVIPDTVTTIIERSYYNCNQLTGAIVPSSVESIGNYAFRGCSKLNSIVIHDGLNSIGMYAFSECSKLTSIELPNSINNIGIYAFASCKKLVSISLPQNITTISEGTFSGCGLTSITIPDTVTSIGDSAFWTCENLKSVTFGENSQLTIIEGRAFRKCSSLSQITIPSSVQTIEGNSFIDCSSLCSVTFENDSQLTKIGVESFKNCTVLSSISIPASVTIIGNSAFYGCKNLATITFDSDIQLDIIDNSAFNRCVGLTSICIPKGTNKIGTYVFVECTNLSTIYYGGTVEQWNALSKGNYWNKNVPATEVICSDGVVSLS